VVVVIELEYIWIVAGWYDLDLEGGFVPFRAVFWFGWFCRVDGGG